MAMFHCSVQICAKRGGGKSSVAAAAYRACESIEDDRTGITHDFTHKGGHVYGEVMLCENAPKEYQDRALLWNAVEKIEKNSNARTAREVEVALPIELDMSDAGDLEKAKTLLRDYINENFVSKGMCADWNIHNPDEDNHNPHEGRERVRAEIARDGFGVEALLVPFGDLFQRVHIVRVAEARAGRGLVEKILCLTHRGIVDE